jgi:hypothetical protein
MRDPAKRKSTRLPRYPVLEEDPNRCLSSIVSALNDDWMPADQQAKLKRVIHAWWQSEDPKKRNGPDLLRMKLAPEDSDYSLPEMQKVWKHFLAPAGPMAYWAHAPVGEGFRNFAARDFLRLITCRFWYKLGGPCKSCGKYFIKKTAHKKIYCSHACASKASAIASNSRIRDGVYNNKLERVKKWISKYERANPSQNWKQWIAERQWVSDRAVGDGDAGSVTITWLTQAVNRGRLKPPTVPRRSAA